MNLFTAKIKTELAPVIVCFFLAIFFNANLLAQCTTAAQYPGTAFTAPAAGAPPLIISTCQYQQEYNQITSFIAGNTYLSTTTIAGTFITIHYGTYNGPVVTFGVVPLTWTATLGAGTYFIHYNVDASCSTGATCMTSTIQNITDFCIPTSTTPCVYMWINNFSTSGGITNFTNNASGCSAAGYGVFTGLTETQNAGAAFAISVEGNGLYPQGYSIWIDWNNNNLFTDAGENCWNSGVAGIGAFSGTITIPAGTAAGIKRMRVRSDYNTVPPSPCSTVAYGESEDYSVNVVTGCTGTPTAGTALASPAIFCASPSYTVLTDPTAETGAGIVYKWQSAPVPGVSWSNIPGAGTLIYTATTTATTYYRLAVKCTTSGITSYSTPVLVSMMTGTETCNGLDDDCDGAIDDGVIEMISISAAGPTTFCTGGSVLLNASYTGTGVQWKKDGINIPGAVTAIYNANSSGNYTALTSSPCGSALSTPIPVLVLSNPGASISAGGPTTFCEGGSVTLTEVPSIGVNYQWYKGPTAIPGATTINYIATIGGNYKCRVTKIATGCYKNSNIITVVVPCRSNVEEINDLFLSIYPNPNNGTFNIISNTEIQNFIHADEQPVTLVIFNNLGQLIYSKELNASSGIINETIEMSEQPPGIYFINIISGNNSYTEKFIKI